VESFREDNAPMVRWDGDFKHILPLSFRAPTFLEKVTLLQYAKAKVNTAENIWFHFAEVGCTIVRTSVQKKWIMDRLYMFNDEFNLRMENKDLILYPKMDDHLHLSGSTAASPRYSIALRKAWDDIALKKSLENPQQVKVGDDTISFWKRMYEINSRWAQENFDKGNFKMHALYREIAESNLCKYTYNMKG